MKFFALRLLLFFTGLFSFLYSIETIDLGKSDDELFRSDHNVVSWAGFLSGSALAIYVLGDLIDDYLDDE